MSLLDVQQVTFGFPQGFLLRDITFSINPAEVLCLMGPNGSGKTTLLALLAGYAYPMAGRVNFNGRDIHANPIISQTEIMFVPFMPALGSLRTPYVFWQAIGHLYGMSYKETAARIDELAPQMHLEKVMHRPHNVLSLGMREKTTIVAAFIPDVKLRILDEPFSGGVDPLGMEVLVQWISRSRQHDESILFSSQLIEHAERLADRIAIIKEGRLTALGTPEDLIAQANIPPDAIRPLAQSYIELAESRN